MAPKLYLVSEHAMKTQERNIQLAKLAYADYLGASPDLVSEKSLFNSGLCLMDFDKWVKMGIQLENEQLENEQFENEINIDIKDEDDNDDL